MNQPAEDRLATGDLRKPVDRLLRTWWATALCAGTWPDGLDRLAFNRTMQDAEMALPAAARSAWRPWRKRMESLTLHPIDHLLRLLREHGLDAHPAEEACRNLRTTLSRKVSLRTIPDEVLYELQENLWAAVEHVAKALLTAHPSTTSTQWIAACQRAHGVHAETPDGLEPVLAQAMSQATQAVKERVLLDRLDHLVAQLALYAAACAQVPSTDKRELLYAFMHNLYGLRKEYDAKPPDGQDPGTSVKRRFEDMRSGRLTMPNDGLRPLHASIIPVHDQQAFCAVASDLRERHRLAADFALVETVLQWHPRAGPTPDGMPRTVADFGSRLAGSLRQLRLCQRAGWAHEMPVLSWLVRHQDDAIGAGEHDWSRHYEGFDDAPATLHGRLPHRKSGRASVVDLKPWNAKLGITFRRAVDDALARRQATHAGADPVLLGQLVHAVFSVPRLPKPDDHYHDFPGWPALYLCVKALARDDANFGDRWLKPLVDLDLDTRPGRSLCGTLHCDGDGDRDGGKPYCCATT
ncbi:hypothetical protein ACWA7J_01735 [Leptothrix sp. BB-4]